MSKVKRVCESAVLTAFQHNLPFQFVFVNTKKKKRGRNKAVVNRVTDLCSKQKIVRNKKQLGK